MVPTSARHGILAIVGDALRWNPLQETWMTKHRITINRAPVLTLWAAVVAERLGLTREEALTMGRALSGLTAHAKGVRLGILEPTSPERIAEHRRALAHGDSTTVRLMGRDIPAVHTPDGLRATSKGQAIKPAAVERYLSSKFGDDLAAARTAMEELAASMAPHELAQRAFRLYEAFRPAVKGGAAGWGADGVLDLDRLTALIGDGSDLG